MDGLINFAKKAPAMMIATIGIDLAKNVFQVHGVDERGHSSKSRKVVIQADAGFGFCDSFGSPRTAPQLTDAKPSGFRFNSFHFRRPASGSPCRRGISEEPGNIIRPKENTPTILNSIERPSPFSPTVVYGPGRYTKDSSRCRERHAKRAARKAEHKI